MAYQDHIKQVGELIASKGGTWDGISPEAVARMRLQNRFRTGLDIARYNAAIMRKDMARYDADPSQYTQSLGCWHGFIGQQKMISIKKHFGTTDRKYLYLSGWMIAALRSDFGPLPDQSMHEKTSVPALIEELYTFLRQADARELGGLFREIDAARAAGDTAKEKQLLDAVENFQTHVVPIIADIDAGFGNAEATYLLAKKMIEAGACALQIENQAPAATPSLNSASRTASSSPAPTRWAPASPSRSPSATSRATSATSTTASSIAKRSIRRPRATAT
jgi:isocitrate lyase